MGNQSNTSRSSDEIRAEPTQEQATEALRQWARRNKSLTEVFLDAYCLVDIANQIVDFNVAFEELCGESYRKILKIGDFCKLVATEICPGQCPARQIATSHKALRLDEITGFTKAFPTLKMILGGVPILSDSGEFIGSLLTIRNVSAESELQKKYDESKQESATDGLTRLFNKIYTESLLLRMIKGSFREINMLSIVLCDIDFFKRVNDTYGHGAGDFVLSTVAQILKSETRDTDVVGRCGGEEFLVVLPNSDIAGVKIFAERFRKRLESTKIFFEGDHIPVTVSLGTATLASIKTAEKPPRDHDEGAHQPFRYSALLRKGEWPQSNMAIRTFAHGKQTRHYKREFLEIDRIWFF